MGKNQIWKDAVKVSVVLVLAMTSMIIAFGNELTELTVIGSGLTMGLAYKLTDKWYHDELDEKDETKRSI